MIFGQCANPLGEVWPQAFGLLEPALKRGGGDADELEAMLSNGMAQLWLVVPGPRVALVTRRDGDTMEVWLCGGRVLPDCQHFLETACEAALQAGMTQGRITGRKGWQRVLAPWGWRADGEDLVKALGGGVG